MANRNDPSGVQEILAALRRDPKMGKHFEIAKIWKHWPEVVGDELAPYGQPLGVRDDTLIVEIESSVWMHRYAAAKWDILNRIGGLVQGFSLREVFLVLSEDVLEALEGLGPQDRRE